MAWRWRRETPEAQESVQEGFSVEDERDDSGGPAEPDAGLDAEPEVGRASGPWDVGELDEAPQRDRIDLGALQLPAVPGAEVRLELEEGSNRVVAVTVALGTSTLQLQAFAAPRSAGIWAQVRDEIAAGVTQQGGTADGVRGPFGHELLARLPTRTPEGRTSHQAARFVGVDGPRWFLRGVIGGAAAVDADAALQLEDVLRAVVVVRGAEAMAPRELLPLRVPNVPGAGSAEQGEQAEEAGQAGQAEQALPDGRAEPDPPVPTRGEGWTSQDDLQPFRRGPEITETR